MLENRREQIVDIYNLAKEHLEGLPEGSFDYYDRNAVWRVELFLLNLGNEPPKSNPYLKVALNPRTQKL